MSVVGVWEPLAVKKYHNYYNIIGKSTRQPLNLDACCWESMMSSPVSRRGRKRRVVPSNKKLKRHSEIKEMDDIYYTTYIYICMKHNLYMHETQHSFQCNIIQCQAVHCLLVSLHVSQYVTRISLPYLGVGIRADGDDVLWVARECTIPDPPGVTIESLIPLPLTLILLILAPQLDCLVGGTSGQESTHYYKYYLRSGDRSTFKT